MRLLKSEINTIKDVLNKYSQGWDLYLHGSRMDDNAKGGDIDLFLVVKDEQYEEFAQKKHYIVSEISLELFEQKIDITIIQESETESHSFFINSMKIKI